MSTAGAQKVYTVNADFEQGILSGVEDQSVGDQLQLVKKSVKVSVAWIPNYDGTVSKLDGETGAELGRYRTAPSYLPDGGYPSRVVVDAKGNCWVGCREAGTVVKIGMLEAGEWIDRNGDGTCQTSRDLNGDGDVTGTEILPWGLDECVLYEIVLVPGFEGTGAPGTYSGPYDTSYWGTSPMGLVADLNGNVWVGTWGTEKYYCIDGSTGQITKVIDVSPWDHHAFTAVIDKKGVIWSSSSGYPFLLKIDTTENPPLITNLFFWNLQFYGLALDSLNHLFVTGWNDAVLSRMNLSSNTVEWTTRRAETYESIGIACSADNDVWVAGSYLGVLSRFDNNGVLRASIPVGSMPSGVSVDESGKVWVCNAGDEYVRRIDPATNTITLSKQIIGSMGHDAWGPMTGTFTKWVVLESGTWSVIYDCGIPGAPWGKISWTSTESEGSSISVRVRASDNQNTWTAWEEAKNGFLLENLIKGRYLEIQAVLYSGSTGVSPVLKDLTIEPANNPPYVRDACASYPCLWPANKHLVDVSVLGVTDPDGDPVFITITGVTSDEPTDSGNKGKRSNIKDAPDAFVISNNVVSLRAERDASRNGRVYRISFIASDGKGGESTGSISVGVPLDILLGTASAVDDGQFYDATKVN